MKNTLLMLFLACSASAQVLKQNGGIPETINGSLSLSAVSTFTVRGFATGFEHVIATATLAGVGSYTFPPVLSSSFTYRLEFTGTMASGTGGQNFSLQFNGDTGSTYYPMNINKFGAGGVNGLSPAAASACHIGNTTSGSVTGDSMSSNVTFSAVVPSSTTVVMTGITVGMKGGLPEQIIPACAYISGATTLSSVKILASGDATWNARLVLWRKEVAFP